MAKKQGKPSKEKDVFTSDDRFKSLYNDPRFSMPKKDQFKVKLDDRFTSDDIKDYRHSAKIDRYGRKLKGDAANNDFERYYTTEDKNLEDKKSKAEAKDLKKADEHSSESEDESESEEEAKEVNKNSKVDVKVHFEKADDQIVDRARGEGFYSSSDEDSSDDTSEEVSEEEELEIESGNVEEGEPSKRLAVVNLDWDQVRSQDLMATFAGFVPSGGKIVRVDIFPSEFGKERMQREDTEGPPKEVFKSSKKSKSSRAASSDDDSDSSDTESEIEDLASAAKKLYEEDDEQDYDSKSLRRYQLQRLRYYYAVVTCDSIKTAKNIYINCDGTEYESTANVFDLRYIPDEMDFDDRPRDSCSSVPKNYKPNNFTTDALQHSKVKLTWDETPVERVKMAQRAFSQKEIDEMDFRAYLASDSDSNSDQESNKKNLYKNLAIESSMLGDKSIFDDVKENGSDDVDMEITFTPGLSEAEALKQQAESEGRELSTIEKLQQREKERKKQRKERIKELMKNNKEAIKESRRKPEETRELVIENNTDAEDDDAHFNMKDIVKAEKQKKRKGKSKTKNIDQEMLQDDFKPDLKDERFTEIFEEHEFAIDPTQAQFKETATMKEILKERSKRSHESKISKSKKQKKEVKEPTENGNDIQNLVKKIKNKSK
ncbi:BA75_00102T0 [Komagataella pastoris]|uniref:BA75_00102T0 n=1 Tax=Komagataella pastoris TaxID=4922 RepID=A0A1B2J9Q6_PICPA|nr:BA75_00102T0 [Komagataella pastoris]